MKKAKVVRTGLVRIESVLKRRLKIEAARRGISMLELSTVALEAYLSKPSEETRREP